MVERQALRCAASTRNPRRHRALRTGDLLVGHDRRHEPEPELEGPGSRGALRTNAIARLSKEIRPSDDTGRVPVGPIEIRHPSRIECERMRGRFDGKSELGTANPGRRGCCDRPVSCAEDRTLSLNSASATALAEVDPQRLTGDRPEQFDEDPHHDLALGFEDPGEQRSDSGAV